MPIEIPERKQRAADVAAERLRPEAATADSPVTQIDIDEQSPDGKRRYKGVFVFKVPTLGDRSDIAALKTRYLQQLTNVADDGQALAEMLAYLAVTIEFEKAPEWWKKSKLGMDLYDYAPVLALYGRCREYEATFLGGGPVAPSNEGATPTGAESSAPGDMGTHVPAAPKRREVVATVGARSRGAGDARSSAGGDGGGSTEDEGGDAVPPG